VSPIGLFDERWGFAMPVEVKVEGADALGRLARRLKEDGNKELRKKLMAGIQRATRPLREEIKVAARRQLPRSGGLNEFVASGKFSTKTRSGGRKVGVRITGVKSGHDIRAIDRGRLRHPVWGNRRRWVNQRVRPGFFTKTIEDRAHIVRDELVDVMQEVAREVTGG
jgi:hypothetical protein